MKYVYHVYESPELIAATIEVETPLPHLSVGHQLLLVTDGYEHQAGTALVIEYVRIAAVYRKKQLRSYEVHVFCKEQVRPPPL